MEYIYTLEHTPGQFRNRLCTQLQLLLGYVP